MYPGVSRVGGGIDIAARHYRSELGSIRGGGDGSPSAGAGGCPLYPSYSRVGGSVDVAIICYRSEFRAIRGGGDGSPVA